MQTGAGADVALSPAPFTPARTHYKAAEYLPNSVNALVVTWTHQEPNGTVSSVRVEKEAPAGFALTLGGGGGKHRRRRSLLAAAGVSRGKAVQVDISLSLG